MLRVGWAIAVWVGLAVGAAAQDACTFGNEDLNDFRVLEGKP